MRFFSLIMLLTAVACGPGEGTPHHKCATASDTPCQEGTRCIDDICEPCGEDHQLCCDEQTCHNGACETQDDDLPLCSATCGLIGMECCANDGCDEGYCGDQGTCDDPAADPCMTGKTLYEVQILNKHECGYFTQKFWTNSQAEADACANKLIESNSLFTSCGTGVTAQTNFVCDGTPFGTYTFYTCGSDPATLAACEQWQCSNCTWSDNVCL